MTLVPAGPTRYTTSVRVLMTCSGTLPPGTIVGSYGVYALTFRAFNTAGIVMATQPTGNVLTVDRANRPPRVAAGAGYSATVNLPVTLRADVTDPDGNPFTVAWSVRSRPQGSRLTTASLLGAETLLVAFVPDAAGLFVLGLTATDSRGSSAACTVDVTARIPDDHPDSADTVADRDDLSAGSALAGTIDPGGDQDFFQFLASAGNIYSLRLTCSTSQPPASPLTLTLYDPSRNPVRTARCSTQGQTTVLTGFRPPTLQATYYVRIMAEGPGDPTPYTLRLAVVPEPTPPPPRISMDLQPGPEPSSVEATIRTSGTSVPLAFLQLLVEYDRRLMRLRDTKQYGTAAIVFQAQEQQFTPPFLAVSFQAKQDYFTSVPAGELVTLTFDFTSARGERPPGTRAAITRVSATYPRGSRRVLRPVTDLDRMPQHGRGHSRGRLRKASDTLFPDPLAPPADNLRPWIRLDARTCVDSNTQQHRLTYRWRQVSEPQVTLSNADSPVAAFVPILTTAPARYFFELQGFNDSLATPTTTVAVWVGYAGVAPVASPRVRDVDTSRVAGPADPPLVFEGPARIVLDATSSTSPRASARRALVYEWTKLQGPPGLSVAGARTALDVNEPGKYLFQLVVRDNASPPLESLPETIGFEVRPRGSPQVTLTAVSNNGQGAIATGTGFDPDNPLDRGAPLRVAAGSEVFLMARVGDPEVETRTQKLSFFWERVAGPVVTPVPSGGGENTTLLQSELTFTPTVKGLVVYECQVQELSSAGEPTGVTVRRQVAIAVDSGSAFVPEASVAARAATGSGAQGAKARNEAKSVVSLAVTTHPTGTTVVLDASVSSSASGRRLGYCWTQRSGPPVELSNPFTAVATFVAPDFGDLESRRVQFGLFVDDELVRGDEARVFVDLVSRTSVALAKGLNLVALPLQPATAGRAHTVADLLRESGAAWVAWSERDSMGRAHFRVCLSSSDPSAPPLRGSNGYLLYLRFETAPASFCGPIWPAAAARADLGVGLNALAYPFGVPPGQTADSLLRLSASAFVSKLEPLSVTGTWRLVPYVPPHTSDWPLTSGRAYFVAPATAHTVTLTGP